MATPSVRLARFSLIGLTVAFASALAVPAVRTFGLGDCEPANWMDWHLAMRRQCLAQDYVCANMTTPKMLADPDVAASYRQALSRGRDHYGSLAAVVGQMRESYGCEAEAVGAAMVPRDAPPTVPHARPPFDPHGAPRGAPQPGPMRLPPGHPPVSFDAPTSVTL